MLAMLNWAGYLDTVMTIMSVGIPVLLLICTFSAITVALCKWADKK